MAVLAPALAEALSEQLWTPQVDPEPRLIDRRTLAAALSVSIPTVDRMLREGCPRVRIGDSPRFELVTVIEWLRGRGQP